MYRLTYQRRLAYNTNDKSFQFFFEDIEFITVKVSHRQDSELFSISIRNFYLKIISN